MSCVASLCRFGLESFQFCSSRPKLWSSWRRGLEGEGDSRRLLQMSDHRRNLIVGHQIPPGGYNAITAVGST